MTSEFVFNRTLDASGKVTAADIVPPLPSTFTPSAEFIAGIIKDAKSAVVGPWLLGVSIANTGGGGRDVTLTFRNGTAVYHLQNAAAKTAALKSWVPR